MILSRFCRCPAHVGKSLAWQYTGVDEEGNSSVKWYPGAGIGFDTSDWIELHDIYSYIYVL